jgi:hypothetical protein
MGFQRWPDSLVMVSAVVLLWGNIGAAQSRQGTDSRITVLVQDSAGIPKTMLNKTETEASRIFRAAGIAVVWLDCSRAYGRVEDACHRTPGPDQFVLHIVAKGKTSSDLVFGLAFLDEGGTGKYSDVFLDRIEQASRESGADLSRLLGTVAAHELGHLLLGSHAHSYAGVMTPVWKSDTLHREDMGCLLFTREQASLMRTRIEDDGQAGLRAASERKVGWKFGTVP